MEVILQTFLLKHQLKLNIIQLISYTNIFYISLCFLNCKTILITYKKKKNNYYNYN